MEAYRFARVEAWLHAYHDRLGEHAHQERAMGDVEQLLKLPDDASRLSILKEWEDLPPSVDGELDALHRYWLCQLFKKWTYPVVGVDPEERGNTAKASFLARNEEASHRNLTPVLLQEVRSILERMLPPIPDAVLPRLGPGAVAEGYSFLEKRRRLSSFRGLIESNSYGYLLPSSYEHKYSRLCAVPKTWDKDRLITVEPYAHVLLQMEAREYLLSSLRLSTQAHYRGAPYTAYERKYWRAFIRGDAQDWQRARILRKAEPTALSRCCTVDLSAASDNITWEMVASVFPGHVLARLEACRTAHIDTGSGEILDLHIYAGMGNATTFVVESLLFYAIAKAVSRCCRNIYRHGCLYSTRGSVTVFGDDIICPYGLVLALASVGPPIKINHTKTFGCEHATRETCGCFTYRGEALPVFRLHGYGSSAENLQNICEVHRAAKRLQATCYRGAMPWLVSMIETIEVAIAAHPFSWAVSILPVSIPGTLSIEKEAWEDGIWEQRTSPNYQRTEYRTYSVVTRYKDIPTPSGLGYVLSALVGSLRTEHRSSRGRTRTYIRVPINGTRLICRWMPPVQ